MATAIVPLKDLVQAKTRLAGMLTHSERRALAQAMAEDVLRVLSQHAELRQVILVSDDPAAEMLAAKYALQCWTEQSLGVSGLNAVLAQTCARLLRETDEKIIILHADMPLLKGGDISQVLHLLQRKSDWVIGTDRAGKGTNLLAFYGQSLPHFQFGLDSRRLHEAQAVQRGLTVHVIDSEGTATDVDEASDLASVIEQADALPASHTRQMIERYAIASRLWLSGQSAAGAETEAYAVHAVPARGGK